MKSGGKCELGVAVSCLNDALEFHITRGTNLKIITVLNDIINNSLSNGKITVDSLLSSLKQLTREESKLLKEAIEKYKTYNLERIHCLLAIIPYDVYVDYQMSTLLQGCNYIISQV